MKIYVEETIKRINEYEIDTKDDEDLIAEKIEDAIRNCDHPDDVLEVINLAGYDVKSICYGAESCQYELDVID